MPRSNRNIIHRISAKLGSGIYPIMGKVNNFRKEDMPVETWKDEEILVFLFRKKKSPEYETYITTNTNADIQGHGSTVVFRSLDFRLIKLFVIRNESTWNASYRPILYL